MRYSCREAWNGSPRHESDILACKLHARDRGQSCFSSLTTAFTHCLELATFSTLRQYTLPCVTRAGDPWCIWEEREGAGSIILQRFCKFSLFLQREHLERNTSPETPGLVLIRQKPKKILGARCHRWQIRTRAPRRTNRGCVRVSSQHQIQSTQDSKTT